MFRQKLPFLVVIGSLLLIMLITSHAIAQDGRADMREAGLLVGNALPFGSSDGVLRYDGRGAFIDNIVPVGTQGITVTCCMTFGPDENLYVSSPLESSILRFNGVTGAFIDTFVGAGSGGLGVPLILLFHGEYLYVGDTGKGAIRRYDAHMGAYIDTFVPDNSQGMGPFDLQHFSFGSDGNLYVAAEISERVLKYDGVTGSFAGDFVPASDGFNPGGLVFGPDGLMYVASHFTGEVRRYNLETATYEEFIPPGVRSVTPVGITFGPDGNLYTTAVTTSEVLHYDGKTGRFLGPFVTSGLGGLTAGRAITWKATTIVCHQPRGAASAKTLTIGYLSGRDHLAHGDVLGACQ